MRKLVMAICGPLCLTLAACGTPPGADIESARTAVEQARSADAARYAPESMQSAQAAWSQLQNELDAQAGHWIKQYDQSHTLATQAKAAADRAKDEAQIARARVDSQELERKKVASERSRVLASAVRVGGPVRPPHKIKDVTPVYPEIARSARIDGTVQLEATVGQDGKVVDARVLQSVPMLDQAALDAVQQWQYEPATQNGKPVPVVMKVNVKFQR